MKKRGIFILFLLCVLAMFSSCELFDWMYPDNGFTYTIDSNNVSCTLTGFIGHAKNVIIPESFNGKYVARIGKEAFKGQEDITSVILPSMVVEIGDSAFYKCFSLSSVTLPNGLLNIGSSTFYECYKLTSINLPDSINSIGSSAFSSSGLVNVILPKNLGNIESWLFAYCKELMSVTVQSGLGAIGGHVFTDLLLYSYRTFTLVMQPTTPPLITNSADPFNSIAADLVIKVPATSLAAYKSATGWSKYASKIIAQ